MPQAHLLLPQQRRHRMPHQLPYQPRTSNQPHHPTAMFKVSGIAMVHLLSPAKFLLYSQTSSAISRLSTISPPREPLNYTGVFNPIVAMLNSLMSSTLPSQLPASMGHRHQLWLSWISTVPNRIIQVPLAPDVIHSSE